LHLAGNLALQSRLGAGGGREKVALSQPGDADEVAADRAAELFDSGGASPFAVSALASAAAASTTGLAPGSGAAASTTGLAPGSGGRKLPAAARADFERFFSRDLGSVRVHDDAAADGAARSMDALAYATGPDIVFRSGQFDLSSRSGRKLLAHELTHVVQGHGGAQRINRTPDAHDTEVRRSQESPGYIWTDPNGLGFSLYNFAIDHSELKPMHVRFLNEIADLAQAGAIVNLEVHGHTDSTGDAISINMPLSLNRATAVADALANAGAVVSSVIPHGESSPVADNGTERGRSRNRRVDVMFSLPPGVIMPERPENLDFPIPTIPEEEDDGWHLRWPDLFGFCEDHPIICGTGLVTLFCALNPEICLFTIPWPWPWPPGGGGDGPTEPEEPEQEDPPTCGDPRLPLTHVEFSPAGTDKGDRMEARPLTRCQGNTVGSDAKRDDPTWPIGWECIVQNNQSSLWARAHLLHFDLHGPGDDARNIIISDKSINGLMYRRVEKDAIDEVWDPPGGVLWYEVQVNHFTGPYPLPYFAESVDMAWGPYDPITGVDGPAVINQHIVSRTQRQPPLCTSTTTPPGPITADNNPPTYQGPSMGPAPEGDDSIPMPTPATAECGGISCRAQDVYRDNVGHFRDGVFIVLADERIVREMIEQEKQFLRLTSHRADYEMPDFDPLGGAARRIGLEMTVTEEARRRVFTFLYRTDPTMIVAGSIEDAVRSDYAR
jgi:outer membrane protein OmpA-like peptidoglycan-associated protein